MSLLTDNGNTKDDLRLPTDDNLLTQVKAHIDPYYGHGQILHPLEIVCAYLKKKGI